jgi:reactive intermediate/imine deaminase
LIFADQGSTFVTMIRAVYSEAAPTPVGAYPHAVVANGFVFCSGQGSRDPETGELVGVVRDAEGRVLGHDVRAQTEACLANVERVLAAAGSGLDRLVELQVFMRDPADFAAMNEVYARHFPVRGPARTTIGVADLPLGNQIEIRAVALAPAPDDEEA